MNMNWILECCSDYDILVEFDNIEIKDEMQELHGLKERTNTRCMFCGNPFEYWKKKDIAHAISECLGNKKLINFCECYECNHLFGEIAENHLGKFVMPYRIINVVYGKGKFRNVVKDMPHDEKLSYGTYRYEQKKNVPVFQSETFDVHNILIEKAGTCCRYDCMVVCYLSRVKDNFNSLCIKVIFSKYVIYRIYNHIC